MMIPGLTIDVTSIDVTTASKRAALSNVGRVHHWHNPIAMALERLMGGFACVTDEYVSIACPATTMRFALTEIGKTYIREWRAGKNDTAYNLFVGTSVR